MRTSVAVEKLILGELIEVSSRQDALQAIRRKRLTIYHPPKSSPFVNMGFFNSHLLYHSLLGLPNPHEVSKSLLRDGNKSFN
jgi:hypothetical protein